MLDDRFLEAYMILRKCLLLRLELPYDLPELHEPERIGSHYRAVIDAYNVLPELPGNEDVKYFLGEMILKWLTGIEMYRRYNREGSAWYREAADMMLTAFESTWGILDNLE
ncbi:Uncharacterised protein [Nocardia otitidiscaviarum]|uniref:Uncharacterized protein n=1 Tax=Nocardia otitidiscaviarum TaxID=1823 RepID=A0A378Y637_9NOCA|nr:hypothetical protein [Nocardia otitidiscaviarum]SUA72612.1 Uncharacterised protein [Nocardia otitidiscaviarum]SUA72672.1 Uncharacterised protein [Nocardia otitidiscaviarum]